MHTTCPETSTEVKNPNPLHLQRPQTAPCQDPCEPYPTSILTHSHKHRVIRRTRTLLVTQTEGTGPANNVTHALEGKPAKPVRQNHHTPRRGYLTRRYGNFPFDRNVLHRTHAARTFNGSNANPGASRNDTK